MQRHRSWNCVSRLDCPDVVLSKRPGQARRSISPGAAGILSGNIAEVSIAQRGAYQPSYIVTRLPEITGYSIAEVTGKGLCRVKTI
jgi:hypothetical protein